MDFSFCYDGTLLLESTVKVNVTGCQTFKEVHSITGTIGFSLRTRCIKNHRLTSVRHVRIKHDKNDDLFHVKAAFASGNYS